LVINNEKLFEFYEKNMENHRIKIFLIFILSVMIYSISIGSSMLGGLLIDSLEIFNLESMLLIGFASTGLFVFSGFLSYLTSMTQTKLVNTVKNKMRLEFYDSVQKSEHQFIDKTSVAEIYQRMFNDINIVLDFYLLLLIVFPLNILISLVVLIIMFSVSFELAVFLIVFCIFQSILVRLFNKPLRRVAKSKIDSEQELIRQISEDFLGNELIRSLGLEKNRYLNINTKMDELNKKIYKQISLNNIITNILGFSSQIINFIVLLFGVYLVYIERLSIGELFFLFSISSFFSKSFQIVLDSFPNFQGVKIHFHRYKDMLNMRDTMRLKHSIEQTPDFEYVIFKDVNFSYSKAEVFKNLNFKINSNSIVLLKGENGSGKTTLLRLIRRFIYPSSGFITLDNININEIDYEVYKKDVIVMLSNDFLVEDTLRENITMGGAYSAEDVDYVLHICGLNSLVSTLENGLETQIGLKFKNLSSGEKRKISLARVLICKPKILLLDEPTAHISKKSSEQIIESIKMYHLNNKCLLIISTHDEELNSIADFSLLLNERKKNA